MSFRAVPTRNLVIQKALDVRIDPSSASREINIHFPPQRIDSDACLRINFAASGHLSIRLLYAVDGGKLPKETTLYHIDSTFSPPSAGKKPLKVWQRTIEPRMVEFEEFVVVVTVNDYVQSAIGIIESSELSSTACTKPSECRPNVRLN